jgi:uncharacterized membrane-anchored protein YhcB (DUF1043 family)
MLNVIMGLFNFNHIENYGVASDKGFWDYALPFIGVIIGFGLTTLTAWYFRWKERTDVWDIFKFQLESYKVLLRDQIQSIEEHKTALLIGDDKRAVLIRKNKFDLIKNLNQFVILKTLKKQKEYKKDKHPLDKASRRLSSIFYSIESIIDETESFKILADNYAGLSKKLVQDYKVHFGTIRNFLASYDDGHSEEEKRNNIMFTTFYSLLMKYYPKGIISKEIIMNNLNSFHKELFKDPFTDTKNELYKPIFEFATNSRDLINSFTGEQNGYIAFLETPLTGMKEIYENFYSEVYSPTITLKN